MPEWIVGEQEAGVRLVAFLAHAARLGSRGRAADALERGKIFVNGAEGSGADAARRLQPGDTVRLWMDRPGSARRQSHAIQRPGLRVLYEDPHLIVLDKPAGLLAVPLDSRAGAASAYGRVEDHLRPQGKRKPLVVHRIDRDTSGLVVFAKHARARQHLRAQFARREPERVYWAVVRGHPRPARGDWRDRLVWDARSLRQRPAAAGDPKGADAISRYVTLETFADAALVEIRLHTGRQNQIRVQASLHGHPLVGERLYTGPERDRQTPIAFPRQALHAVRLSFHHPADGRPVTFESAPPADFAGLLARLRRRAAGGRGA
jgi:23S rRNA pseudouridine1911/1915/1917 synthase